MVTRLFHEYLFKLVVTVAVTGTVAAFALINKYWTWPNAVVGVVLLASGLSYLMDRLGIGPSTKSRVRDWLDSSAFQIQTIQDTNEFHFRVMDNVFISTDILQAKAGAPVFLASAKHLATPAQVAVFKSLTDPQRAAFWKKVRLELLRYGVEIFGS